MEGACEKKPSKQTNTLLTHPWVFLSISHRAHAPLDESRRSRDQNEGDWYLV